MKRKITTENHVKEIVKDWFHAQGAWHYAPVQTPLGVHGIHDRIGCVPVVVTPDMVGKRIGLFVSVESKRPGRRGESHRGMSAHQLANLTEINAAGGFSVCCDGYEDIAGLHHLLFQQELPLV